MTIQRKRYSPIRVSVAPTEPFESAEHAWFWYIRCQKAREDGARFDRDRALIARPCDPDDVYRAVKALARRRKIGQRHLSVLRKFGLMERPPDHRCHEEMAAHILWDEALDKLTSVLKAKAIVE